MHVRLARVVCVCDILFFSFFPSPLSLHQLENRHGRVVTLSRHSPENPAVASVALGVAVGGVLVESVDELLVVDEAHGLTTGVEGAVLGELDLVVDVLSDGLGADEGGLDAAVSDHLGG